MSPGRVVLASLLALALAACAGEDDVRAAHDACADRLDVILADSGFERTDLDVPVASVMRLVGDGDAIVLTSGESPSLATFAAARGLLVCLLDELGASVEQQDSVIRPEGVRTIRVGDHEATWDTSDVPFFTAAVGDLDAVEGRIAR